MTREVVSKFMYAVSHGLPKTRACDYAGIAYDTYGRWAEEARLSRERGADNEYTDFIEKVRRAESEFALTQIDRIDQHGKRSWTAAAWLLERRFPTDFGMRQALEVSAVGSGSMVPVVNEEQLSGLTTDELLALDTALRKLKATRDGQSALVSGTVYDGVSTSARSDPS